MLANVSSGLKNPGRAVILKLFIAGLIIAIATGIEVSIMNV